MSRRLLIGWAVVVVATIAIALAVYGTGEDGLRVAIRSTAKLSVLAIACAVAGFRVREALVALPMSHAAHFAMIFTLAAKTTTENVGLDPIAIPGGALIYSLMIYAAVKTPRWAIYLLWMIFVYAIAIRMHESWVYPPIVLALLAAAAIRFIPRRVESPTAT